MKITLLIMLGEHLKSSINFTHKLETMAKSMRTGIETYEAQSIKTAVSLLTYFFQF
jgi:hypothetical protein